MAISVIYDSKDPRSAGEVTTLSKKNTDQLEFIDTPGSAFTVKDENGTETTGLDAIGKAYAAVGLGPWYEMYTRFFL